MTTEEPNIKSLKVQVHKLKRQLAHILKNSGGFGGNMLTTSQNRRIEQLKKRNKELYLENLKLKEKIKNEKTR